MRAYSAASSTRSRYWKTADKGDGEEEHDAGEQEADAAGDVAADADDPVDGLDIPPAPVLVHQHGAAALNAEDQQSDHKDGDIGQGDGGHGPLPQHSHHKGVHHAPGRW